MTPCLPLVVTEHVIPVIYKQLVNMSRKYVSLILLFFAILWTVSGQSEIKSIIKFNEKHIIVGYDHSFLVVGQQSYPIALEQLTANQIDKNNDTLELEIRQIDNAFLIKPLHQGDLLINVSIDSAVETKYFKVQRLKAVPRLSIYDSQFNGKINSGEFRAQQTIRATSKLLQYEAFCQIISFTLVRAGENEQVEKYENEGGKFNVTALQMIRKAKSGDIYIFRQIMANCDGGIPQQVDDLIVEIE